MEPSHTDLVERLKRLEAIALDTQRHLLELQLSVASTGARRDETLNTVERDLLVLQHRITKHDDRAWRVAGAITLSLLSILGSAALFFITT